ncbi:uncharacterized protein LOC111101707 [Crassostrea virginica]
MAKKCLPNGCSPNSVYHCVANENMKLVEVCTETIYLQGVCPFYDTGGKLLQMGKVSCKVSATQNCSDRYISTTVYKYPVCYPSISSGSSEKQSKGMSYGVFLILLTVGMHVFVI